jgi:hypothetical protein
MHSPVGATRRLRCVVCRSFFDFAGGDTAVVLRHVAYGYDFAHDGACLTAATEWIFPEPGFDCAAFARDPQRRWVLDVACADGWAAILRTTAGRASRDEPLLCWVVIEYRDGTSAMEGVIRDDEWQDEPGGAEFATNVVRTRANHDRGVRLAA